MSRSVIERLWAKIDREGPEHPTEPELGRCWVFTGSLDRNGYGLFHLDGKTVGAHRLVFVLTHGEHSADDLNVCHSCDRPGCVNPRHLFAGTQQDNMQDCTIKGRHRSVSRPDSTVRGERHGNAANTDAEVAEMLAWVSAGFKQSEVAEAFGVTRQALSRWVRGERRQIR